MASCTMAPVSSAFRSGDSTGAPSDDPAMRNTSSSFRPTASRSVNPVSPAATGLISVIRSSLSVAMTPSPIDSSVSRNRSASCSTARRLLCSSVTSPEITMTTRVRNGLLSGIGMNSA